MANKRTKKVPKKRPGALRRGQLLEIVAHAIELEFGAGSAVTYNATILEMATGTPRQIDIAIETEQAGRTFLRIVEVKDSGRPVSVNLVDEIDSRMSQLGAHRATIFSTAGFAAPALQRIRVHGHRIDARHLAPARPDEWPDFMGCRTFNVRDGAPAPLTHRRLVNPISNVLVADIIFGRVESINGVVCFISPPGGRAPDLRGWILGDDPTLAGLTIVTKYHEPGEPKGARVDAHFDVVNRWAEGQPIVLPPKARPK